MSATEKQTQLSLYAAVNMFNNASCPPCGLAQLFRTVHLSAAPVCDDVFNRWEAMCSEIAEKFPCETFQTHFNTIVDSMGDIAMAFNTYNVYKASANPKPLKIFLGSLLLSENPCANNPLFTVDYDRDVYSDEDIAFLKYHLKTEIPVLTSTELQQIFQKHFM